MRECKRCSGVGGKYQEKWSAGYVCNSCYGSGQFADLDVCAIVKAVLGRKGLRSARPKYARTVEASRAYYVWRLARFHSGLDMRMPMAADLDVWGDPYRGELDQLSEATARVLCGTDTAACRAWGRALTGNNLPESVKRCRPTIYDSMVRAIAFPGELAQRTVEACNLVSAIGNVGAFLSAQLTLKI